MRRILLSTFLISFSLPTLANDDIRYAIERVQQFINVELPKLELHQQRVNGNHIPEIQELYQINPDGTVTDKALNITWMRCSLGQVWDGKTCAGNAKTYTWRQAQVEAKKSRFAGKADWRVPTIEELRSLVYCSSGQRGSKYCEGNYHPPTILPLIFLNTASSFYWSASPYAESSNFAWGVYFKYGGDGNYGRDYYGHMRLVRSGQ